MHLASSYFQSSINWSENPPLQTLIQSQVDNQILGLFRARIGEVWAWVNAACVTRGRGRSLESFEVP